MLPPLCRMARFDGHFYSKDQMEKTNCDDCLMSAYSIPPAQQKVNYSLLAGCFGSNDLPTRTVRCEGLNRTTGSELQPLSRLFGSKDLSTRTVRGEGFNTTTFYFKKMKSYILNTHHQIHTSNLLR